MEVTIKTSLFCCFVLLVQVNAILQKQSTQTKYEAGSIDISYKTLYFDVQVDHFSFANQDMYKMRYLVNDQFWDKDGGPIFFYCGNEGDIEWFCNNTGSMWEWAPEFKAMLVFAEHRYYGKSLPYGTHDKDNMGYLSSQQALADYAALLLHMKASISGAENSPIIAFGGSYGGMLATWFRMKYPYVVQGSLAASAPIWMFGDLTPCDSFYKTVTADFAKAGPNCAQNIKKSWQVMDSYSSTESGREFLSTTFRLCSPLTSVEDVTVLKDWLYNMYGNLAMVDYPYPASFLEPLPAWPIKQACEFLVNGSLTGPELMGHLVGVVNLYFNSTGQAPTCFNTSSFAAETSGFAVYQYQVYCSHMSDSSPSDESLMSDLATATRLYYNYTGESKCLNRSMAETKDLGDLGWDYQACTEMYMPQCTTGINDMFEARLFNATYFAEDCKKTWGVGPRPDWIITEYGGKDIKDVTNIIFSNGGLDPWSGGGVLQDISDSLVSIFIPEGAHHLDLRASNPADPPSVVKAREQEKAIVKKWIKEYRCQSYMEYVMETMDVVGSGARIFNDGPLWIKRTAFSLAGACVVMAALTLVLLLKNNNKRRATTIRHESSGGEGIVCKKMDTSNVYVAVSEEKAPLL